MVDALGIDLDVSWTLKTGSEPMLTVSFCRQEKANYPDAQ